MKKKGKKNVFEKLKLYFFLLLNLREEAGMETMRKAKIIENFKQ